MASRALKSLGWSLFWMALLLALDQASKAWVRVAVPLNDSTPLIPHLINLTHVENRGVSFSFLAGLSDAVRLPLLLGISVVAVGALSWFWLRHRAGLGWFTDLAFVLILPGAVGNLIDRAVYGTVTDFFHFHFYDVSFFVNNVADILISAGVVAYCVGQVVAWWRRPQAPGGA